MDSKKKQTLDVVRYSASIGIALNNTTDKGFNGRTVALPSGTCINFSICDYLGLSRDIRLKQAAASAALKYGVYTAISRTYMKLEIYRVAEELMEKIFRQPCLIVPRTTLGHISAIPVITDKGDAIILDHQVHTSVRLGAQIASSQGVTLDVVRHSRLDLLEEKIRTLSVTHKKIWYMADGIYSMYGDPTPVSGLMQLLDKYPSFHLYVDDAHGTGWMGENGRGYFLSHAAFHRKLIICTSLGKGFGSGGGVIVCPDHETKEKIEILGAPLMFTSPVAPPTLGSIIASAAIHLSPEIIKLQTALKKRIKKVINRAHDLELPVIGGYLSPITFIATGKPDMTSDICRNLLNRGFFVTGGVYPAVPFNNSGVRIITTLHQKPGDIDNMLNALKTEYDKALKNRGVKKEDLLRFYKNVPFYDGLIHET
jgi:7-keto-8-aminopelargonate synthetase-like enzyme